MREEDEIHVNNIVSCINEIEGYVEGMSYEEYAKEEEVRQSVASNLQEIGEAATLLSDDFTRQFTAIDMKVLESLKRAKFDEGLEIDHHGIWSIVSNDLPTFRDTLSSASEALDDDEDDEFDDDDDSFGRGSFRRSKSGDDDDDDEDFDFDIDEDIDFDDDDFDDDDDDRY